MITTIINLLMKLFEFFLVRFNNNENAIKAYAKFYAEMQIRENSSLKVNKSIKAQKNRLKLLKSKEKIQKVVRMNKPV